MEPEDKLAAATLAAARCNALGLTSIDDYFSQYQDFVTLFVARAKEAPEVKAETLADALRRLDKR